MINLRDINLLVCIGGRNNKGETTVIKLFLQGKQITHLPKLKRKKKYCTP